ncbi:unnamed protein product [Paramecium sonneborni]|uniref:EGF-like domain-containing protein n=1 Tax=Paramecium sonneborni TaxID=65129 RepID=A0A8S1R816_9CILI|nr:unnamed protein product [Paramecium sonneborni]
MPFMMIQKEASLFALMTILQVSVCQWTGIVGYYCENEIFTNLVNVGGFSVPSQPKIAQNTDCTNPPTSYIILYSQQQILKSDVEIEFISGDYISMDLFFQSNWQNGIVNIKIGGFNYEFQYSSPNQYPLSKGFCDNIQYDVKTVKFEITSSQKDLVEVNTNINSNGKVSIRNFYLSRLLCYPLCKTCKGAEYDQCSSCYNGSPTNNICQPCPDNKYLMQNECKTTCDFYYRSNYDRTSSPISFEQDFPNEERYSLKFPLMINDPEFDKANFGLFHGIFTKNTATYRFVDLSSYQQGICLIGIRLSISFYNDIPVGGGIEFKINNTYYGSIQNTNEGKKFHRTKLYQEDQFICPSLWTNCQSSTIFLFVDIPKYSFVFTALGNYKTSDSGWSIREFEVSSGYCQSNCKFCEIPYVCQICNDALYISSEGNCVPCNESYETINSNFCDSYDQETQYSKFLIKNEYFSQINDPLQTSQYILVSQKGVNFLKGSSIFYSLWKRKYIFGGQFVWSQAKFKITHEIKNPHHRVTIGFYILYGKNFPSDGKFIYTFEQNQAIIKSRESADITNDDETKSERMKFIEIHFSNTLTLYWECSGDNNNPQDAYCGIYGYNVVVHYCQPNCLQCLNYNACQLWDNSVELKYRTANACQSKKYYNKQEQKCLSCPATCLTCTSAQNCQSCVSTYSLMRQGCSCLMNQYEANNQCYECPIGCNQCLSDTHCLECVIENKRVLQNGQCVCLEGYYSEISNPVCQKCKSQLTCQCTSGTSYDLSSNSCTACHSTCLTCFNTKINGCLSCDLTKNRILKGLKCSCKPGYYEQSNSCLSCPTTKNSSLTQCFKLCLNNTLIWHSVTCESCDPGFKLVLGECMPVCGDFQIVGYEECEDGNNDLDDLCFNCQYQCPNDCQTCTSTTVLPCSGTCGDGIVNGKEECDDGNNIEFDGCHNCKFQCAQSCTKCVKGKCQQCVTKRFNNSFLMSSQNCQLQCGYGYLIESDYCLSETSTNVDGCQICRFNCRSDCSNCDYKTATCLDCDPIGFKPYSSFCKNNCGDGLAVYDHNLFYSEYCDDGNIIDNDGCSGQCKYECQDGIICTSCINTRCYACGSGFYLSDNYDCQSKCGDAIKTQFEQCDIELPYRGCQDCLPKCQNSCLDCSTIGLGCLQCQTGYQNIDNMCYTICGDQYITPDEQCDDGNLIFEDGCHFCENICTFGCSMCQYGICYDCNEGFTYFKHKCIKIQDNYKDPRCNSSCLECSIEGLGCLACKTGFKKIDNVCYSICGDKLRIADEQCDDDNLKFEDGCHQCQKGCPIGCSNCQEGVCIDCLEGFSYFKNQCIKIHDIYRDPRCESSCLECSIEGSGCLACSTGFNKIDNVCYSVCGDSQRYGEEQCDDANFYYEDGCHQCRFECPMSCSNCNQGVCYKCHKGFLYFKHQCFEFTNAPLAENSNFKFTNLIIDQFFIDKPSQINRIQAKIFEFPQQDYDSIGQFVEGMDSLYPNLTMEVYLKCFKNKKLEGEINNFRYNKGFDQQSTIFIYQCHETYPHLITYSFKIHKKVLKDEILIITIFEDFFELSTLVRQYKQILLQIKFTNI